MDSINSLFSNKILLFITLFQLLLDILQLSIGAVLLTIVNSLKVFVLKLTEEEKFFIQPPLFRILWKSRFFKVLIQYPVGTRCFLRLPLPLIQQSHKISVQVTYLLSYSIYLIAKHNSFIQRTYRVFRVNKISDSHSLQNSVISTSAIRCRGDFKVFQFASAVRRHKKLPKIQ